MNDFHLSAVTLISQRKTNSKSCVQIFSENKNKTSCNYVNLWICMTISAGIDAKGGHVKLTMVQQVQSRSPSAVSKLLGACHGP